MEDSREMATTEDKSHGAQSNCFQEAKLLREQVDDFLEGGSGEVPREKLHPLLSKVVSYVVVMNPVLWGSFPMELLVLVFAHLPVPEITLLYYQLSKEWTMNMEFNRACDEAHPNMAALVSSAASPNEFWVRIFDFSKYVWLYEYCFCLTNHQGNEARGIQSAWMQMASDGGLVRFVSTWNYKEVIPLCFVVINPLTRVQHELPPLRHVFPIPPTLVHMKVDSETKGYKVVVVFNNEGCLTVETYDSISREWSRAAPSWGHILGHAHQWKICDGNYFVLKRSSLCAFDLEEGQLEILDCNVLFQSEGAYVMQHALVGDRVFVLHNKWNKRLSESYSITLFQFQSSGRVWVLVRTYDHFFPEGGDLHDLHDLYVCEDVLMVRTRISRICSVLNLLTNEWYNLPEKSEKLLVKRYVSLMCRVFWHATP